MKKKNKNKKAQVVLLDIIAGGVIIVGGVLVTFGMINLGSLVATVGLLIELIKLVIQKGL